MAGRRNNPPMTTAKTPAKRPIEPASARQGPDKPAKRPPNARGQGRKPTPEGPRRSVSIRLSDEQRQKLARLGGVDWMREQIDMAKEPK